MVNMRKMVKTALFILTRAMASDGVFIYVPEGVVLKKPVQIVNLVQSDEDIFNQHRNLIIVEKNADITLIGGVIIPFLHRNSLQTE